MDAVLISIWLSLMMLASSGGLRFVVLLRLAFTVVVGTVVFVSLSVLNEWRYYWHGRLRVCPLHRTE